MNNVLTAIRLLPDILALVVAINQIFQGLSGAGKKEILQTGVKAAMKAGGKKDDPVEMVGDIADSLVETLNSTGFFSHAGALGIAGTPAAKQETTPILDATVRVHG